MQDTKLDELTRLITETHADEKVLVFTQIYRCPLFQTATDSLNRQLKAGIEDHAFAELVLSLRANGRLCIMSDDDEAREPRLICGMGLAEAPQA